MLTVLILKKIIENLPPETEVIVSNSYGEYPVDSVGAAYMTPNGKLALISGTQETWMHGTVWSAK